MIRRKNERIHETKQAFGGMGMLEADRILNDADEMQGKAHVFKVDIDECRDIAMRYHVSSVPTLMLFKNGEVVKKNVGAVPKHAVLAMFD